MLKIAPAVLLALALAAPARAADHVEGFAQVLLQVMTERGLKPCPSRLLLNTSMVLKQPRIECTPPGWQGLLSSLWTLEADAFAGRDYKPSVKIGPVSIRRGEAARPAIGTIVFKERTPQEYELTHAEATQALARANDALKARQALLVPHVDPEAMGRALSNSMRELPFPR